MSNPLPSPLELGDGRDKNIDMLKVFLEPSSREVNRIVPYILMIAFEYLSDNGSYPGAGLKFSFRTFNPAIFDISNGLQ